MENRQQDTATLTILKYKDVASCPSKKGSQGHLRSDQESTLVADHKSHTHVFGAK